MKYIKVLPLLFSLFFNQGFSQAPVGGLSVSGIVCTQGQVYTWGLNKQGYAGNAITGTLGTGSSAQNIPVPTQVVFPVGVLIRSLGESSGNYFLAIDCSGKVWGWGDNSAGQLGIGNKINQTTPQKVQVQAGSPVDLAGFRDPVTGQLIRISKVYAGNASSLALTDDGRLLSWGCNGPECDPASPGILGNGTSVNALYPTFVVNGVTGAPLQNVIDMSIGDHLAMALVDENQDGIGIGTVYTWGDGSFGILGRNATGTGNTGSETTASNMAKPARLINNTSGPSGDGYLRNIKSIAAGAVAGYAIDADGYVWAWGNGGYGGTTGQGTVVTHSDPRRVLRGVVTSGKGQDGQFLLARSIAAGNAFAVAVTLDGMPVAWGNNACSSNPTGPAASPIYACGGNLGNNGVGNSSATPVFVQNSSSVVHTDVRSVVAGAFWAYYLREDNSMYAWGDNIVGQLGMGGYTTQNKAIPFPTIAAGCSSPDPIPYANLTPNDTIVCESRLSINKITLNSNIKLSPGLINQYQFTWYRVANPSSPIYLDTLAGNIVKQGKGVTFSTLDVVLKGRYWLKVKYLGTNSTCGGYPNTYDYATIDAYPRSFNPKNNLTYCGNEAEVSVSPVSTSKKAIYDWYPTPVSTSSLGKSVGNGTTSINVSSIAPSGNGNKVVYVEETSSASGTVIPTEPSSTFNDAGASQISGTSSINTGRDMYFSTGTDLRLDTISLYARSYSSVPEIVNFRMQVFGTTLACGGKTVADRSNVVFYGPTVSATVGPNYTLIKIPVNASLSGGKFYFLGLTSNFSGAIRYYTGVTGISNSPGTDLSGNTPKVDDIYGYVLKVYGTDEGDCLPGTAGIFGSFFNWKFSTKQEYCDRVPVTLTLQCTVTELEHEENLNIDFKLYPNPSNSFFTLASPETSHIRVLDFNGKEIENRTINGTEQIGENWPTGIYVLLVNNGNGSRSYKLSKVR